MTSEYYNIIILHMNCNVDKVYSAILYELGIMLYYNKIIIQQLYL